MYLERFPPNKRWCWMILDSAVLTNGRGQIEKRNQEIIHWSTKMEGTSSKRFYKIQQHEDVFGRKLQQFVWRWSQTVGFKTSLWTSPTCTCWSRFMFDKNPTFFPPSSNGTFPPSTFRHQKPPASQAVSYRSSTWRAQYLGVFEALEKQPLNMLFMCFYIQVIFVKWNYNQVQVFFFFFFGGGDVFFEGGVVWKSRSL